MNPKNPTTPAATVVASAPPAEGERVAVPTSAGLPQQVGPSITGDTTGLPPAVVAELMRNRAPGEPAGVDPLVARAAALAEIVPTDLNRVGLREAQILAHRAQAERDQPGNYTIAQRMAAGLTRSQAEEAQRAQDAHDQALAEEAQRTAAKGKK